MSNFRGLLDALRDPKNSQGLLDMGVSLMGASGPSPVPMSFGQRIAQGYMGSQQMAAQRAQQALEAKYKEAMIAKATAPEPQRSMVGQIQPEKYTPASVAKFQTSGNYADLEPVESATQQPRYVAPGGVLLGPDNKELYRNNVPDKPDKGREAPSGYKWSATGNLEAIPGGPADPNATNTKKGVQPLRKEFRALQSVKDYETALPLLVSARKAPDNGYGDLQLIYTAGKVLDPGSVVREGELALTVAAGSPLQRIIGQTRFSVEKGGRLTPETRKQLLEMLNERVMAYRQGYDRDYQQYADYANESGVDQSQIVGRHAANAYQPKQPDGAANQPAAPKRLKFEDLPK